MHYKGQLPRPLVPGGARSIMHNKLWSRIGIRLDPESMAIVMDAKRMVQQTKVGQGGGAVVTSVQNRDHQTANQSHHTW